MSDKSITATPAYAAAKPHNEAHRLAALRSYSILDTDAEAAFDDLTKLAAIICETPVAVVNLIDEERQWFKSEVGLGTRELPLNESICAHAILQPGLMEIPDTMDDARFNCNPLVTGPPGLRFYAGELLLTTDGYPLGTLCVLDYKPKRLTTDQREALSTLARQVMAQLELRKTLTTLTKAMSYRAQLMAIAGHDLRQPLQIMSMTLAALTVRFPDSEKPLIERATRALQTLSIDLDQLARSSRLTHDDVIATEPVDLNALLCDVVTTWALHAERKGIALRIVPTRVVVQSNRGLLSTILGNLVGNAIKYTERGRVVVGCRIQKGSVVVQVWDSGRGIPDHALNLIFDAFTQLDGSSEGLGLGLNIVRQSAELLGHRLSVRSWPGKGSCFGVEVMHDRVPVKP